MNTSIEIHDNNTNETGTYRVYYTDPKTGLKTHRTMSENYVNALLEVRQKEAFFMGKFKFKVKSIYDFTTMVVDGRHRPGL